MTHNRTRRLPIWLRIGAAGFLFISTASACLNEYDPNAALAQSHSMLERLTQHPTKESWPAREDRLRKLLATSNDFRLRNDLATTLIHMGKTAEAVTMLEKIEADKPGLYSTASNLGTAYELSGKNELALEWIRKGIERNPEAHEGTEWLHARILEAKIGLAQNPGWLKSHDLLTGLPKQTDGSTSHPATGNRGEILDSDQVKTALIYQLHERLQFVPPPDVVVGQLLLQLGFVISMDKTLGPGKDVFKLANRYLQSLPETDQAKQQALDSLFIARKWLARESPVSKQSESALYVTLTFALALVALLLTVISIFMKRNLQRRMTPSPRTIRREI